MTVAKLIEPASLSLQDHLDQGPWTAFQKRAAALAILAVVLDGFDIQLIGVAIPGMMRDWNLPRSSFVPVIALGLVAMCVGTAIAGQLGDRFGRRTTLIASLLLFGIATLASIASYDLRSFLVLRMAASFGLGGALPNAVALLSEFTPRRRRSFAVTIGMICTPLGGIMAGMLAAAVLASHPWQLLFLIGGLLPILFAIVLIPTLPESPKFLLQHPRFGAALDDLARKLNLPPGFGQHITPLPAPPASFGQLFGPGLARDTLFVWMAFLGVLTSTYTVFNWFPTLLGRVGFGIATGGAGLAAFNLGGIGGAILGSLRIDRTGSKWLTICFAGGGVISTIALALLLSAGTNVAIAFAGTTISGLFIAGLQPMLIALAAHIYPDHLRSTGVGAGLAVGRLGAIAASGLGSFLVDAGAMLFFLFLAIMLTMVIGALTMIKRHVPRHPPVEPTTPPL